jgi:endonuclease I
MEQSSTIKIIGELNELVGQLERVMDRLENEVIQSLRPNTDYSQLSLEELKKECGIKDIKTGMYKRKLHNDDRDKEFYISLLKSLDYDEARAKYIDMYNDIFPVDDDEDEEDE